MKKILSSLFAVLALMTFAQFTFAAPFYTLSVHPVSEAVKKHMAGEYGNDTVISIINYSHRKMIVTYPTFDPWMSMDHNTSTRVWAPNYTGPTFIRIQEDFNRDPRSPAILGPIIWEGSVSYRATVSVDDNSVQVVSNDY